MGESRPRRAAVTAQEARWSQLHHGVDAASVPLLRPWLRLLWRAAGPFAKRGVSPTALTGAGVLCAGGALACAPRRPRIAFGLVVAAVLCDGLDGAVAVVADRACAGGAVADAVADRVVDGAFAAVLWRCGAPARLAALDGALAVGVDLARRLLRVPDRITVGERPSWAVCAALACASSARTPARWPAVCCAAVWTGLGVVAGAQVLVRPAGDDRASAVRRAGAARASGR